MAVQVSNRQQLNFGTLQGDTRVTHGRIQRAADNANPIVKAFAAPINAQASNALIVNAGAIDVIHNEGETTDDYIDALVKGYWGTTGGNSFKVDLMSSATTVIADPNYVQLTVSEWDITNV